MTSYARSGPAELEILSLTEPLAGAASGAAR